MHSDIVRQIVLAALDAIIMIDAEGRVIEYNPAAERLFGWPRAAVLGRTLTDFLVPPELRGQHSAAVQRAVEGGVGRLVDRRMEVPALRADGSRVLVELTVTRVDHAQERPGFVGFMRDVTARSLAEAKYRTLFDSAPVGIYQADRQGQILTANGALARMLGVGSPEELLGANLANFYADPAEREALIAKWEPIGAVADLDVRWRRRDGTPLRIQLNAHAVRGPSGETTHFQGFVRDVSERWDLEEQLRQAQKMDAVGRLAGGIAHDFNNLLTAITGYLEIILDDLPPDAPHREDLEEVRHAGERAAELTQQLLAFSRKQVRAPRVLDINAELRGMESLLRRLIGANITVTVDLDAEAGRIVADSGQLHQVVLNLVVNARDAMPEGGTLRIGTARAVAGGAHAVPAMITAGEWVVLTVTDNGVGMDADTIAHLFEPFFTTKPRGRGTGLGLATVYGIVRQSGGHVTVASVPGEGSAFSVFLPCVEAPVAAADSERVRGADGGAGETVLLVEDEASVRALLHRTLERAGYRVLAAADAEQAIRAAQGHDGPIHLLLTDVIMPGRSGPELARDLAAGRPAMRSLFMSGYTADQIGATQEFLQKPFTQEVLLHRVRSVLGGRPLTSGAGDLADPERVR